MKILLRDFNAKLRRENIFKPTFGNESLHQGSYDNGVTIVNFATPKNLGVNGTKLPHRDIHKYTWTSLDGASGYRICDMDWIVLAQDRDRWRALVNAVMNLWVP
jgi:hypothetical protein